MKVLTPPPELQPGVTFATSVAEQRAEALKQDQEFYLGPGFTDQCHLIPVRRFRQPIYQFDHSASARFPEHAGHSFERRVDAWMHCQGYLRLTHRRAVYVHRNFE